MSPAAAAAAAVVLAAALAAAAHSFIHSYSFIKSWQNASKQLQQPKLETIKIKDKSADIYPIYEFRVMMYER